MFRLLAVEGIELFGQSVVRERRKLRLAVTTEEGDSSGAVVTEVREEEGEGGDEREAIQESGK